MSRPLHAVPAAEESAATERSTPDETETDKTPVDEGEQQTEDAAVGASPSSDSPGPTSGEEEAEAEVVEAVAEPATVPDSTDIVDEVAAPVEMDDATTGERWEGKLAAGSVAVASLLFVRTRSNC